MSDQSTSPQVVQPQENQKITQTAPEQQNEQQQPEITLNVDQNTHMMIAIQDYDRKIADAEATVANLKKEKANFIYETNVNFLINQAKQEQESKNEINESSQE